MITDSISTLPRVAVLATAFLTAHVASAALTYSGLVNIPIPNDFNGVYLDLAAGTSSQPPGEPDAVTLDSYTLGYAEPTSWDVNFFFGGIGIAYSPDFEPFLDGPAPLTNRSQILNVALGTVIRDEEASRTLGINVFGGSGRPNQGTGESHFDTPDLDPDPTYSAFRPGVQGYLAFLLGTASGQNPGWMRVTLHNDGTPGIIHDWAYSDDSSFAVGAIPEPSAFSLTVIPGLLLLLHRRRKSC